MYVQSLRWLCFALSTGLNIEVYLCEWSMCVVCLCVNAC